MHTWSSFLRVLPCRVYVLISAHVFVIFIVGGENFLLVYTEEKAVDASFQKTDDSNMIIYR